MILSKDSNNNWTPTAGEGSQTVTYQGSFTYLSAD